MHTLLIIAGGIVALAVVVAIGSRFGSERRASMARATTIFIPIWLGAALANMYVGVVQAGYTVLQELPFLIVVFGVPAALALLLRGWLTRR
ncbi:MAG: hypothetical protein AAFX56_17005 [Pseudomonadota bacterium]